MISKETVKYVAELARIHLNENEIEKVTQNLESILHFIEKLEKCDITGIEPTSHVLSLKNVYREDIAHIPLTQDQSLGIAVATHNGAFKVPQIIE